ncbi:hypothetical protein SEA_CEN1621_55 [Microbacterium phage Cen1621]|uniref:Uncharacterized protein n=1 Tax=Microbacterium phage Cen1621 TaxID=2965191 RepID=A0A9E7QC55_9CAUD|nr:hypothetical protein SEA_CEN1621_55 [Microbacterium phage Cen1621]
MTNTTKTTQTATLPDGRIASRVSSMPALFAVAVAEKDGTGWEAARWSKTRALAEKFAATITPGYPTAIVEVTTEA